MILVRKLQSAYRVLTQEGCKATGRLLLTRISDPFKKWFNKDQWLVGMLVVLRGNRWPVDGLFFTVNNPTISTKAKSRFVRNQYERWERELAAKWIIRDLPAIDVGSCIGVVSCLVNKMLANPEKHVCVEASPQLLPTLVKNKKINNGRFHIEHAAVGYNTDYLTFYLNDLFVGGSTQRKTKKSVQVPTISLAELIRRVGGGPVNLTCDIEGAEIEIVRHELDVLKDSVATMILEYHPKIIDAPTNEKMFESLQAAGFEEMERIDTVVVFTNKRFYDHTRQRDS